MWRVVTMGLLKAPTLAAASAISAAIPLNSLPPGAPAKSNQTHPGLRTEQECLGVGIMVLVGWLCGLLLGV